MSDYLKGSFTGEEEAWWLWFGITAVMADKLMDSRPSWLFTWLPSSHCFPAFIWKGQGTTHCPAEKDIQINGKGINHFLREQSKKYWSVLFNFSERSSTIMHLLTCFQSLHRQEVGGRFKREGMCTLMADSRWCMSETNTILQSNYPPPKNK